MRNLPKREFFEAELKEFMRVVSEEWSKTLSTEDVKLLYENKKLVSHIKVMRDDQK